VSPDGAWRWDGRTWTPLTAQAAAQAAAAGGDVGAAGQNWLVATDLDNPDQYASGPLPPKVDQLPGGAAFGAIGVAIGQGWAARRPMASWHLLHLATLRSVAVVPPTAFTQFMHNRSLVAPHPDLALQDQAGSALRLSVGKLDADGCGVLGRQIPSPCEVTPAAASFLQGGSLPGNWGKPFQLGPWRF
jgi:hypothetical protein